MTNDSAERHLQVVQEPEPEPQFHEVNVTLPYLLKMVSGMVSKRGLQVSGWVDVWDGSVGQMRTFPRWHLYEEVVADLAEFEVHCPKCGAGVFEPCIKTTGPNTGQRAEHTHSARSKQRLTHPNRWLRYTADGPEVKA